MKVHYPKLYNMAHLLALNVLLLPKDLTIIFIYLPIISCSIYIFSYLLFIKSSFYLSSFPVVGTGASCLFHSVAWPTGVRRPGITIVGQLTESVESSFLIY